MPTPVDLARYPHVPSWVGGHSMGAQSTRSSGGRFVGIGVLALVAGVLLLGWAMWYPRDDYVVPERGGALLDTVSCHKGRTAVGFYNADCEAEWDRLRGERPGMFGGSAALIGVGAVLVGVGLRRDAVPSRVQRSAGEGQKRLF